MKNLSASIALCLTVSSAASAATTIAYWNFNSQSLPGGGSGFTPGQFPFVAEGGTQAGSASFTLGGGMLSETSITPGGDETLSWVQAFTGSTLNGLNGDGSGSSLSIQGGTGSGNNGGFIQFSFDATEFTGLGISWAGRGTGSGFGSSGNPNRILWSTDGVNFSELGTYTSRQTSFELYQFGFGTALDGVSEAHIRIVLDGASNTLGNNRLDNIQITGTLTSVVIPLPGPAGMALAGIGLCALRRRR